MGNQLTNIVAQRSGAALDTQRSRLVNRKDVSHLYSFLRLLATSRVIIRVVRRESGAVQGK